MYLGLWLNYAGVRVYVRVDPCRSTNVFQNVETNIRPVIFEANTSQTSIGTIIYNRPVRCADPLHFSVTRLTLGRTNKVTEQR